MGLAEFVHFMCTTYGDVVQLVVGDGLLHRVGLLCSPWG